MSERIQTRIQPASAVHPMQTSGLLQRKCACRGSSEETCEQCKQSAMVQRKSGNHREPAGVPSIIHDVLRSPGNPLDASARAFFEPRFGHDFSKVRVHADDRAAQSAQAVDALAYTVGSSIAFASGQYAPQTKRGQRLLAHELTHVMQQNVGPGLAAADIAIDSATSDQEGEARRAETEVFAAPTAGRGLGKATLPSSRHVISRADPNAVGYTKALATVPRTGIQFWPTNVTDTKVGQVTARGGLLTGEVSRLHVIIAENLTPRLLARELLPLFITATPFTPPGAVAPLPLDIITEDELAKGLLVYNQTYVPVPAMTGWRAGLHFPLPVEIDPGTGMATLHPSQVRALAGAFDPAWVPLLDRRAGATAAPPAATLAADVAAFLAAQATPLARGVQLGSRALTNPVAELPFIREAFHQLGPAGFDVALAFMGNLLDREVGLLTSQWDGAAILAEIRTALAAGPVAPTAAQQTSLTNANLMLGRAAGVAAQAPPGATRTRAEKTITVDTVLLDGSNHHPATDVALADAILSQCNVHVTRGVSATATHAQTLAWLGGDTDLKASPGCGSTNAEERALFNGASAAFGLGARFRAFFPATLSGMAASGYSYPPFCATGPASPFRDFLVAQNSGDTSTLAHELGHILLNSGAHPAGSIMSPRPAPPAIRPPQFSDPQCTGIYNNA